jgi:hypothetical protein
MDPLTLSAQFAAYTWFEECLGGQSDSHEEAMKFAQENWRAFQGSAQVGLGQFLIRVGRLTRSTPRGKQRPAAGRVRILSSDRQLTMVDAE